MRKIFMILCLVVGMVLTSCHQDEDFLFADVAVALQAGDGVTIERVQGTVSLTNLNTKQVFTISTFVGNVARGNILRSSYSILVEGTAQCRDASGKTQVRQFRASTDYVGLEKEGLNETTLNMIWM